MLLRYCCWCGRNLRLQANVNFAKGKAKNYIAKAVAKAKTYTFKTKLFAR